MSPQMHHVTVSSPQLRSLPTIFLTALPRAFRNSWVCGRAARGSKDNSAGLISGENNAKCPIWSRQRGCGSHVFH